MSEAREGAAHQADFTVDQYRDLVRIARSHYAFALYDSIPTEGRFVLWRHDCDFSLNRAHTLALIEQDEGVRSTFFVNPHCEFYNPFEKSQWRLVSDIRSAGHDIGLHFDVAFHELASEDDLDTLVSAEAGLLENLYGVPPTAFSFHNPTALALTCEKEAYGGLINCYATRFKREIGYCSDSNGYWRHRRLRDVLEAAEEPRLQVLTHPDWWQDEVSPPRQRVFRSIYGRADAAMRFYDDAIAEFGRRNLAGPSPVFDFLRTAEPKRHRFYDELWNRGRLDTLFIELWRQHAKRARRLGSAGPDGARWQALLEHLLKGGPAPSRDTLEEGCFFLCKRLTDGSTG